MTGSHLVSCIVVLFDVDVEAVSTRSHHMSLLAYLQFVQMDCWFMGYDTACEFLQSSQQTFLSKAPLFQSQKKILESIALQITCFLGGQRRTS